MSLEERVELRLITQAAWLRQLKRFKASARAEAITLTRVDPPRKDQSQ